MIFSKATLVFALFCIVHLSPATANTPQEIVKQLHIPTGFSLSIYADNVPNARSLALGDNGIVFVGSGPEGKVYALQDKDQDGIAEQHYIITENLIMPNSVAYKDGSLYVAEIGVVYKVSYQGKS